MSAASGVWGVPGKGDDGALAGTARIVIADDHDLARIGLRSLLDGEHGLTVVGEATTGREAVALCRRLRPDLVLMDVHMPDFDGLAATRAIRQTAQGTHVLIVTNHDNPAYIAEALQAGAEGYLLKEATHQQITTAVRRILAGAPVLLHQHHAGEIAYDAPGGVSDGLPRLTPREQDILRLIARGQTNLAISYALGVGLSTVKTHVEHIIAKLGVADRTQAAVRALELGLVRHDTP